MNDLLQNLLKLQVLEFGDDHSKSVEAQMAELRKMIPSQITGHYDRLAARGKKGVAPVRNQVCTGCYMKLPIGTINTLLQGDIQLCDNCGRYLYLARVVETPAAEPVAAKPAPKLRKRKASANAPV